MKKIITKIFKRFGYSPKSELEDLTLVKGRECDSHTLLELIEAGEAEASIFMNCLNMRLY